MSDEDVKKQNAVRKQAIKIDIKRQVKQAKERQDKDGGKDS